MSLTCLSCTTTFTKWSEMYGCLPFIDEIYDPSEDYYDVEREVLESLDQIEGVTLDNKPITRETYDR